MLRSLPCQIKPGLSVAAVVIGAQWGAGLSWHGLRVVYDAPCTTLSHLAGVGGQPLANWPWTYSQGCSRSGQIKPDLSVTAVVTGVQWGVGLGWHG